VDFLFCSGLSLLIAAMASDGKSESAKSRTSIIDYLDSSTLGKAGTSPPSDEPPKPVPGMVPQFLHAKCGDCKRDAFHKNTLYCGRYTGSFLPFKNANKCMPCANLRQRTGQDVTEYVENPGNAKMYLQSLTMYEQDFREANPISGQRGRVAKNRNYMTEFIEIVSSDLRRFTQEKDYGVAWPIDILMKSNEKNRLTKEEIEKKKERIFDKIDQKWVECVVLSSSIPREPGCIKLSVAADQVAAMNTYGMNSESAYSTKAVKDRWQGVTSASTKMEVKATDTEGVYHLTATPPKVALKRLSQDPDGDVDSDASMEDELDYLSGIVAMPKGKDGKPKSKPKTKPQASTGLRVPKRPREEGQSAGSGKRQLLDLEFVRSRHADYTKASSLLSAARTTLNNLQTRNTFFATSAKDLMRARDALTKAMKPMSSIPDFGEDISLELEGGSMISAQELKKKIQELMNEVYPTVARLDDLESILTACQCGSAKKGDAGVAPSTHEVRGAISLAMCKGVQIPGPAVEIYLALDMEDHINQGNMDAVIKAITSGAEDDGEPSLAMIGSLDRMVVQERLAARIVQFCMEHGPDNCHFHLASNLLDKKVFEGSPGMSECLGHFGKLDLKSIDATEDDLKTAYAYFQKSDHKFAGVMTTTAGQTLLTIIGKTIMSFANDRRFEGKLPLLEKLCKQLVVVVPSDPKLVARVKDAIHPLQNMQKEFGDFLSNSSERFQAKHAAVFVEHRDALRVSAESVLAATDVFAMSHLATKVEELVSSALATSGEGDLPGKGIETAEYTCCQKLVSENPFFRWPLSDVTHELIENQAKLRSRIVAILTSLASVVAQGKKDARRVMTSSAVKDLVDILRLTPTLSDGEDASPKAEQQIWFGQALAATSTQEQLRRSFSKLGTFFREACGQFLSIPCVINLLHALKAPSSLKGSDVADFEAMSLSADFGVTQVVVHRAAETVVERIVISEQTVSCAELALLPKALSVMGLAWKISESLKLAKRKDKLSPSFPTAMNQVAALFKHYSPEGEAAWLPADIPRDYVFIEKIIAKAGTKHVMEMRSDFETFIIGVVEKDVVALKELAPDGTQSSALMSVLEASDVDHIDDKGVVEATQCPKEKKMVAKWMKMEPAFKAWQAWFTDEVHIARMAEKWEQTTEVRKLVASNTLLNAIYAPIGDDQKRADIIKRTIELKVEPLSVELDPKLNMIQKKLCEQ
jgi:hypothetical protein